MNRKVRLLSNISKRSTMSAPLVPSYLLIPKPRTDYFRQASLRLLGSPVCMINYTSFQAGPIARSRQTLSNGPVPVSAIDICHDGPGLSCLHCRHQRAPSIPSKFQKIGRRGRMLPHVDGPDTDGFCVLLCCRPST